MIGTRILNINLELAEIIEATVVHLGVTIGHFKVNTGCLVKLFPLGYLLFCRLLVIQIAKVGTFLKNSGNLLHDRHKNFENRFRNS